MLVVLLTFQAAQWTTLKPELLANLAAGIFIMPFFLFSATAGQLADKYDKAALAPLVKLLEVGIMVIAGLGFWLADAAVVHVAREHFFERQSDGPTGDALQRIAEALLPGSCGAVSGRTAGGSPPSASSAAEAGSGPAAQRKAKASKESTRKTKRS